MPVTVTTAQGFTWSTKFQTLFIIPKSNPKSTPHTGNEEISVQSKPPRHSLHSRLKQNHPSQVQLSHYHICRLYRKSRGTQPLQLSKSNMHSCSSIGYLERSMSQATVEVILFGATWTPVSYIQTEPFPQNSKDWVENFETLILTKKTVFKVLLAAAWVCGKPRGRGNWKKVKWLV